MDFSAFLRAAGLTPTRGPVADGRWHRCPTETHPRSKNGSYKLAADNMIGWAQDHAAHTEPLTWRPDSRSPSGGALLDHAAIRRAREEHEAARRHAAEAARAYYTAAAPLRGGHPYLDTHGLDMAGCRGIRIDARGWLVLPMLRDRRIISVQRVGPAGEKLFWPGAPTAGTSYVIDRRGAAMTVLCEGIATGLALYGAVPHARVLIAFSAGNLPRVAALLPRRGLYAVAADNDHATEARIGKNPGLSAARDAADILGCSVASPRGIAGTDWCDYRAERIAAIQARVHGRRTPTPAAARREADGEIAREVMRAARMATTG